VEWTGVLVLNISHHASSGSTLQHTVRIVDSMLVQLSSFSSNPSFKRPYNALYEAMNSCLSRDTIASISTFALSANCA
jgi:hypothetical protein